MIVFFTFALTLFTAIELLGIYAGVSIIGESLQDIWVLLAVNAVLIVLATQRMIEKRRKAKQP